MCWMTHAGTLSLLLYIDVSLKAVILYKKAPEYNTAADVIVMKLMLSRSINTSWQIKGCIYFETFYYSIAIQKQHLHACSLNTHTCYNCNISHVTVYKAFKTFATNKHITSPELYQSTLTRLCGMTSHKKARVSLTCCHSSSSCLRYQSTLQTVWLACIYLLTDSFRLQKRHQTYLNHVQQPRSHIFHHTNISSLTYTVRDHLSTDYCTFIRISTTHFVFNSLYVKEVTVFYI